MKILLLALVLPWFVKSAFGQTPAFYTLDQKDNLPSNEVYQLIQGDDDYMYIGCAAGLFKYDGFTYRKLPGKNVNATAVSGLTKGSDGRIWCQNFAGQIYYASSDSLHLFRDYSNELAAFPEFAVTGTTVVISLPDHLVVADDSAETRIPYPNNEFWRVSTISAISPNEIIIAVFNKGLFHVDLLQKKFSLISDKRKFTVRCNSFLSNGKVYVISERGLQEPSHCVTVKDRKIVSDLSLEVSKTNFVYQWKEIDGYQVVTTSDGVFIYPESLNKFFIHAFPDEDVSSVCRDKEGNWWFSTLGNGIKVVASLEVLKVNDPLLQKNDNHITASLVRGKATYFGSINGNVFKFEDKKVERLQRSGNFVYRRVTKILPYKNKILVSSGGLTIFEGPRSRGIVTNYIRDMALQGDSLFMITSSEFGVLDLRTETYTTLVNSPSFRRLTIDPVNSSIFLAGTTGTLIYKNGKAEELRIGGRRTFSSILHSDSLHVWVATPANGVYGMAAGKIKYHYPAETIRGSNINAIATRENLLYITTEAGLNILDRVTDERRFLGKRVQADFQGINHLEITRDTVHMATQSGLFLFPVSLSHNERDKPRIALTSINYQPVHRFSEVETTFSHNQGPLHIQFKAISLSSLRTITYHYRLLGFSNEWRDLNGATDYVSFDALKPGHYEFQVRATNGDGVSSDSVSFRFTIERPFWQQWWFIGVIAALASSIVAVIFLLRLKAVRRQNEQRQKLVEAQLTALKAQMNPHFMYNAINSIQDLVVRHEVIHSNIHLGKLSTLMRKVLDVSSEKTITLAEELAILELYLDLEKLRFGYDFSYVIRVSEDIEPHSVLVPPLLLQPFIENALKHGLLHRKGEKKLVVDLSISEGITCRIIDNGIGRKKSGEINARKQKTKSFATAATQKRIELLNQNEKKYKLEIIDLEINGQAIGTEVILTFPRVLMVSHS